MASLRNSDMLEMDEMEDQRRAAKALNEVKKRLYIPSRRVTSVQIAIGLAALAVIFSQIAFFVAVFKDDASELRRDLQHRENETKEIHEAFQNLRENFNGLNDSVNTKISDQNLLKSAIDRLGIKVNFMSHKALGLVYANISQEFSQCEF